MEEEREVIGCDAQATEGELLCVAEDLVIGHEQAIESFCVHRKRKRG